jgi:hypothetical protein
MRNAWMLCRLCADRGRLLVPKQAAHAGIQSDALLKRPRTIVAENSDEPRQGTPHMSLIMFKRYIFAAPGVTAVPA